MMPRGNAVIVTLAALLALAGCMRAGAPASLTGPPGAPDADSVTTALWHLDETGGTHVPDSGPFQLNGVAGLETRTEFGRFARARAFTPVLDSFIYVDHNPLFDFAGSFTIEAWIRMARRGTYEATPIVARWSPLANEQSWLFGIVGDRRKPPAVALPSPGLLEEMVAQGRPGNVVFAFQPENAGPVRGFVSARAVELDRWTHVAASYDGEVVRIYVDGQLDGQYATNGRVRPSVAPLIIGNLFDERWLGQFGGDLRIEQAIDGNPYYAYNGLIDEVRISSAARTEFPAAEWR